MHKFIFSIGLISLIKFSIIVKFSDLIEKTNEYMMHDSHVH